MHEQKRIGKIYANIPVAIINGEKLVNLMFEHNLGVSIERKYEIKKIDSEYFDSFMNI